MSFVLPYYMHSSYSLVNIDKVTCFALSFTVYLVRKILDWRTGAKMKVLYLIADYLFFVGFGSESSWYAVQEVNVSTGLALLLYRDQLLPKESPTVLDHL